jgi:hypothetical protein
MKQFFKQLFNKKSKIMVGKKVKLVMNPSNKKSSANTNRGNGNEYIVSHPYDSNNSWMIKSLDGRDCGWAYEWEMESYKLGIKGLEQELSEAKTKLDTIQSKINWMNETGSDDFSEDEFKVYQTLKLLENGELSLLEKSKLIAELIKK